MQTASDALKTAATGTLRQPKVRVNVKWNGIDWADESAYVKRLSGTIEASSEQAGPSAIGASVADTLTLPLRNPSGRFAANRADGALYANISGNGGYGKLVKAEVGFVVAGGGTEYNQQFTGYLKEPGETLRPRQVIFTAHGKAGRAAQTRKSTVLYTNVRSDTYLETLRQLLDPAPSWATGGQDIGLDYIPYVWLDDEPIWEEMVRVAESEGGRVYFDKDGNLRFENYTHLLTHSTSLATFTTARFSDLAPRFDWANIWNHVIVKFRPRFIAGLQTIWQAAEAVSVPPSSSKTVWAQFQSAAYDILTPVSSTDWTARTASYIDKTANLTVTIPASGAANRYAQRVLVTFTNANATHQLYVDGLQLRGYPILVTEERAAEASNSTSITAYGERVLEVDNLYIQSEEAAQATANGLLYRYKNPRQVCELRGVPGLPYLEIGDRVTVTETATGINRDFFVVRIDWKYDRKFTQDLTLIDIASIYEYSDYFLVGATALGAVGRAYY